MDNKEIVLAFLEAQGERKQDEMKLLIHEDVNWWPPPSVANKGNLPRPIVGYAQVPWLGGGAPSSFKPGTTKYIPQHVLAEGDLVSAYVTREAIGSNGKPYENEYNWLFRIRDGKIAEVWEVLDTAHAFEILFS